MLSRANNALAAGRVPIALVALAASGCFGVGMGKLVPGSRPIERDGGRWVGQLGSNMETWHGESGGKAGTGMLGGVIAGRFGLGSVALGDRLLSDAGAFDLRLELAFSPLARFGVAASAGWQVSGASGGGTELSRMGFPLTLVGTVVPFTPFLLRAGGFVKPGTTTVDEVGSSGLGRGLVAGAGVQAQFIGWHFVAMIDWEREYIDEVMTPAGGEAYVSDFFLLDIWVIGW